MTNLDPDFQRELQSDQQWQDCLTALADQRASWADMVQWPEFATWGTDNLGAQYTEMFTKLVRTFDERYASQSPSGIDLLEVFNQHMDELFPRFESVERLADGTWRGFDTAYQTWMRTRAPQEQQPADTGKDADWEIYG